MTSRCTSLYMDGYCHMSLDPNHVFCAHPIGGLTVKVQTEPGELLAPTAHAGYQNALDARLHSLRIYSAAKPESVLTQDGLAARQRGALQLRSRMQQHIHRGV